MYAVPNAGWHPPKSAIWPLRIAIIIVCILFAGACVFFLKMLERQYKSERMLETMSSLAKVGAWSFNLETKAVYWSDMTKQIFKLPLNKQPQWPTNLDYFKPGYSRDKIRHLIEKAIKEGESFETQVQIITVSGEAIWVLAHGESEYKNGRCIKLFGSLQNIDARKRVELENNKIALHNEILASLTVHEAVLTGNLNLSKHVIVKAICQALEVDRASIWLFSEDRQTLNSFASHDQNQSRFSRAVSLQQIEHPNYFDAINNNAVINASDAYHHPFTKELASNYFDRADIRSMLTAIIPTGSKSMGVVCAENSASRRHWSKNEESFLIAVAALIGSLHASQQRIETEHQLVQAKNAAEQAVKIKGEFLASMSHEIRTPLNGIIGTVDMLRDSNLDETQRRQLHVIEQSGNTLLDLINDVLDYSRLDAGKMPIEQTRLDLPALIGECVALFEHRARLNANTLSEALDPELGEYCVGDPVRLRQILVNLISNAVKFTENGRIQVSARRDEANRDYVLFEITDTGIGIPADQQSRLFDYFHQGDQTSRRRYGGTGLGLAICRQLAEIMGGEIGFQSSEAGGSRFWVRLPLPAGKVQDAPVPEEERPASVVGARLLIVDDNHINLLVAEGLCRKLGHQCETAESGAEALAVLLSRPAQFDLILMDCEMPDMDGFETTRSIQDLQRQGRLPVIPVIALTAHAVPDKIAACHDAGMIGHIAKPVNLRRLDEALSGALRGIANGR